MSEYGTEGVDMTGLGEAQTSVGRGKAKATAQQAASKVQAGIDRVAGRISEGVSKAADCTVAVYDRTATRARKAVETVQPMVRERPFAAAGVALGLGVVIGMLMAARSPKVIYIKPHV